MPDTTTLNETTRSPIDGTEWMRLATVGTNWRAQLSQLWLFAGGVLFAPTGTTPVAFSTTLAGAQDTPTLELLGASRPTSAFAICRWNAGTNSSKLIFASNRGATIGNMTAAQANDEAGGLLYNFADGTLMQAAGYIAGFCDATPSTNVMFGRVSIWTNRGGIALTESLRTDSTGLSSFTNTAGFGYGVAGNGDGGSVTQATSRTTGVTLNTVCGAITLFTAAPTVGTWVTFTVTNSKVGANDTILLSVKSGSNTYVAVVSAVAAGSFQISFMSIAGTASDAPVINFSLTKGVIT